MLGDIIQVGGAVVLIEGTERLSCGITACRVAMGGSHLPPIGAMGALPWEKLNWGGGGEGLKSAFSAFRAKRERIFLYPHYRLSVLRL